MLLWMDGCDAVLTRIADVAKTIAGGGGRSGILRLRASRMGIRPKLPNQSLVILNFDY
jgi:hypothetical protein